jgi:hypothetical protein
MPWPRSCAGTRRRASPRTAATGWGRYLFFLKTPLAEPVLAADDMAFLDRLRQDWSPGYDASENLRDVKQCLRGKDHLAAAIGYYRADEPGLSGFDTDGAYAAQEQALARCGPAAHALPARQP